MSKEILSILKKGTLKEKRSLFTFNLHMTDAAIMLKFNLWQRYFFIKYFKSDDAEFHDEMNLANLSIYRGSLSAFVNIAFRGAAKDAKTKLFIAFVILNDETHFRRYFKVLTEDGDNSKQTVTDIYNMLVNHRIKDMYPEVFERTDAKREERMSSFTTSTGVKITADTVGVDQRGANQDENRPDFIWFNDFETRKTLRSVRETKSIWENMEEARTGLEKGGGCVYTCNYVSEQGNVHKLVTEKLSPRKKVFIIPISKDQSVKPITPMWERYTVQDIKDMINDDEDFEGERLCKPNASKDLYFDRETLDQMEKIEPEREIAGFRIYKEYKPGHRYASGHDVAGGVGLDSSASVFIDFDTIPAQVVATFDSNTIAPEAFGDEVFNEAEMYGACLVAPENNKYDQVVLKAKILGAEIFKMPQSQIKIDKGHPTVYGWTTTSLTKSRMLDALRTAIIDGSIELNDRRLIQEASSYTRNDLIDEIKDPRNTTRHFDLLMACCIAWQMKDYAKHKSSKLRVKEAREARRQRDGVSSWQKKERINPAL